MAAIVFPDSPSTNSVVFADGRYWIWSSETWEPFNPVLGRGVITGGTITGGSSTVLPTTFQVTEVTPEADDWSNKRVNLVAKSGATGAAKIPAGTTAQRDATPTVGDLRVNTTTGRFEGYISDWNGLAQTISPLLLETRTGNTQLVSTDIGKSIDVTAGAFTQTFDTPSNLGVGWWCYYKNSSDSDIGFTTTLSSNVFPEGTIDVISDNLVLDNGFDNPALWSAQTGWAVRGGAARATAATAKCTAITSRLSVGNFYKAVWSPVITSGSVALTCGGVTGTTRSASGTYTEYMTATSSSLYLDAVSSLTAAIPEIKVYKLNGWTPPSSGVTWDGTQFTLTGYSFTTLATALRATTLIYIGQTYEITYTITRTSGSIALVLNSTVLTTRSASGTYTETITATDSLPTLWVKQISTNFSGTISDISIRLYTAALDADLGINWYMYPGEERLIYSTGSKLKSKVTSGFTKRITASGVYIDPPGYKTKTLILLGAGGGGAGGDSSTTPDTQPSGGSGGGGGGITILTLPDVNLSGYCTIGTGGAGGAGVSAGNGSMGTAGGNTSITLASTIITSVGGSGATTTNGGVGGAGYTGITGGTGGVAGGPSNPAVGEFAMCSGGSGGGGANYDTTTPSYTGYSGAISTPGLYGIGGKGGLGYSANGSLGGGGLDGTYGCGGGGGGGCGANSSAFGGAGGRGGNGLIVISGSI